MTQYIKILIVLCAFVFHSIFGFQKYSFYHHSNRKISITIRTQAINSKEQVDDNSSKDKSIKINSNNKSPNQPIFTNPIIDSINSVKETYVNIVDGVQSTIDTTQRAATTTVSITQKTITTIQEIPQTVQTTIESVERKRDNLISEIKQVQDNTVKTAKVVKKIVTLEAARETVERFQAKVTSITDKIKSVYSATLAVVLAPYTIVKWATAKRADRIASSQSSSPQSSSSVISSNIISDTTKRAVTERTDTQPAPMEEEKEAIIETQTEDIVSSLPIEDVTNIVTADVNIITTDVVVEEPEEPQFLWDRLMSANSDGTDDTDIV